MAQFLLCGGVLFAVAPRSHISDTVVIDAAALDALRAAEARRLGEGSLTVAESRAVGQRAVEDELLYREGLRLGFDRDDPVVRQRVIQKVLFLSEEMAGANVPPGEADLMAFFERTRARWSKPERVHLIHVFASTEARAAALATALEKHAAADVPPPVGEPFPLARSFSGTRDRLAADYGAEFADATFSLAPDRFSGPIRSRFGWHLVKVLSHDVAAAATFADVHDQLPIAYLVEKKQDAVARFLRAAFERYTVSLAGTPLRTYAPTGRIARAASATAD
jgi:hypothetical protein